MLLHSVSVCEKILTIHSRNDEGRLWAERSSANGSVVVTQNTATALRMGKGCSSASLLDTCVSGILWGL